MLLVATQLRSSSGTGNAALGARMQRLQRSHQSKVAAAANAGSSMVACGADGRQEQRIDNKRAAATAAATMHCLHCSEEQPTHHHHRPFVGVWRCMRIAPQHQQSQAHCNEASTAAADEHDWSSMAPVVRVWRRRWDMLI